MSRNRTGLSIVSFETRRNISRIETGGVKPIFESGGRTIMAEGATIPHTLQRRHLVIPRPFMRIECVSRVKADLGGDNVSPASWKFKSLHRHELVIGVERRCVATGALQLFEQKSPAGSRSIEMIRIRRRAE